MANRTTNTERFILIQGQLEGLNDKLAEHIDWAEKRADKVDAFLVDHAERISHIEGARNEARNPANNRRGRIKVGLGIGGGSVVIVAIIEVILRIAGGG